jgi:putative endonuclease
MYYTYVLLSEKDDKFYIGFTEDLENRIEMHESGKVPSTSSRRPFKLLYYEACLHKKDALKREKYFKTGFGRRFLKNRLESFFQTL